MNPSPPFPTTQIKTWTKGTAFKFTVEGTVIDLEVYEIQPHMMTAVIMGGPRDGQQMTWSLDGSVVHGISQ